MRTVLEDSNILSAGPQSEKELDQNGNQYVASFIEIVLLQGKVSFKPLQQPDQPSFCARSLLLALERCRPSASAVWPRCSKAGDTVCSSAGEGRPGGAEGKLRQERVVGRVTKVSARRGRRCWLRAPSGQCLRVAGALAGGRGRRVSPHLGEGSAGRAQPGFVSVGQQEAVEGWPGLGRAGGLAGVSQEGTVRGFSGEEKWPH